jgi:hypothetical protein
VIERVLLSGLFMRLTLAPLAGMVMRGPDPNLQRRARSSERVPGFFCPDHFDHLPMLFVTSSQLFVPFSFFSQAITFTDGSR